MTTEPITQPPPAAGAPPADPKAPPTPPPERSTEHLVVPVEIRGIDEGARAATMLVCKYGERSQRTSARGERFLNGAFTRSVSRRGPRIPFTDRHTGGTGQFTQGSKVARPVQWLTDKADELLAVLRFYDTPEGWAAYLRAKDGELDAGSVGFQPVLERSAADGTREIAEAELHHVMLMSRAEGVPAYDAPGLLEVRQAQIGGPEVAALLAVDYSHIDVDGCVDPAELARIGGHYAPPPKPGAK